MLLLIYHQCDLQEFLLLDRSGLLLKQDFQEHERRIECNMQSEASFHTRTPCVSLCYGKHACNAFPKSSASWHVARRCGCQIHATSSTMRRPLSLCRAAATLWAR